MRKPTLRHTIAYAICAGSLLLAAVTWCNAGGDEREALLVQQRMLRERIETLKYEQDYLLFEKMLYRLHSKYLVIDTKSRTGQLKYQNRVLKDFKFTASGNFSALTPRAGIAILTSKVEGKPDRHALVFGKSFVMKWKLSTVPRREASLPAISLTRKELLSVFYAVETGSMAFILRSGTQN